jgi:hypothetical protein
MPSDTGSSERSSGSGEAVESLIRLNSFALRYRQTLSDTENTPLNMAEGHQAAPSGAIPHRTSRREGVQPLINCASPAMPSTTPLRTGSSELRCIEILDPDRGDLNSSK